MFSVFLLVAFMRHWKESGIIIRAGIVAALMKSLSPSAVIFGPMIAIFMEALIIEACTLFLGRHLISYMLAGALAVVWALVQKIINFIIIYGFDIVKIADAFYQWLLVKTGIENLPALHLVLAVIGLYAFVGIIAALAGYFSGTKTGNSDRPLPEINAHQRSDKLSTDNFTKYNAVHIFLIFSSIIVALLLINEGPYWSYIAFGISFLLYILLRYKNAIRYFKKPKVWIQFLILALTATLLWEWLISGQYFSLSGLEIGIKMIFRAMIIIFGFAALGVELRNPLVRSILQRNGLSNLYIAINLAFSSLPAVIDDLPAFSSIFKKHKDLIFSLLQRSDQLLEQLKNETRARTNLFILTGATQSGKTSLLEALITQLSEKKISCAGFLAPGTIRNNERHEISIKDIQTKETFLLSSKKYQEAWLEYRKFYFKPSSFEKGNLIIRKAIKSKPDLLILDEVGPMEMRGKGWYPSLELLKKETETLQIWVVREKMLKEVRLNYMIPEGNVIDIKDSSTASIINKLGLDKPLV